LLHRQTGIEERCADSYMIVGTFIGFMVEHNYIIILILKAEETCLSATHYSDGLKGSCVYQSSSVKRVVIGLLELIQFIITYSSKFSRYSDFRKG